MRDLVSKFKSYEEQWEELNRELDAVPNIPIYHFFKSLSILKRMEKLTNNYSECLRNTESDRKPIHF